MPPIYGPLYALADRDDDWHHRTVRFLQLSRDELIPVTVLPEAAYLLSGSFGSKGRTTVGPIDCRRRNGSRRTYHPALAVESRADAPVEDAQIGFVDATAWRSVLNSSAS